MAKRKRRSRRAWRRFLVIWAVLLLVIGALGCAFLYKYLDAFESTRPELTMDELMASYSADDWYAALSPTAGTLNEYEDAEALYADFFDATVRDAELEYRSAVSRSSADEAVFSLYAGITRIGEVSLLPKENGTVYGFGRHEWQLGSVTARPLSECLQAVTVLVDAPDGESVYLNGVELRQEQVVDPAVSLEEISALEQRFTTRQRLVRYSVSPLYGAITVTDAEGTEIAPSGTVENGSVHYVIKPRQTYSFRIEAPEGIEVNVSGAVLGEEDVTGRESNMFRKLDVPGGGYETLQYAADGLYSEPVITASYNGVELKPVIGEDGRLFFFYPTDAATNQGMRDAAEEFFGAYTWYSSYKYNGVALKNLSDRILPGTELYSYVNNSYDAMIWASATEVSYEELSFDNYHFVSDDCFTCTIRFKADYTAQQWYSTVSYAMQDGYKMVFIRSDGSWLAASMSAFDS